MHRVWCEGRHKPHFSQRLSVGQCRRHCCAPLKARMSMLCIDASKYHSIFGIASNASGVPLTPFRKNFRLKFLLILLVGAYPQTPHFFVIHKFMPNTFFVFFSHNIFKKMQKKKKSHSSIFLIYKIKEINK